MFAACGAAARLTPSLGARLRPCRPSSAARRIDPLEAEGLVGPTRMGRSDGDLVVSLRHADGVSVALSAGTRLAILLALKTREC